MAPKKKGKTVAEAIKTYKPSGPTHFDPPFYKEYAGYPAHGHSPHSFHGPGFNPEASKFRSALKYLPFSQAEYLFAHRLCPHCGWEAVDGEWHQEPIEIQSIGKHSSTHLAGPTIVRLLCSNGHEWELGLPPLPPPLKKVLSPWTGSNRVWLEGELETLGTEGPEIGGILPALGELVRCEGQAEVYEGAAGSEVTPAEPPELRIGDRSLLNDLYDLDGRRVALLVELAKEK